MKKRNLLATMAIVATMAIASPVTAQASNVPNGLAMAEDGNWYYYNNGAVDFGCNGLVQNEYGWWYVENGAVNFNASGLVPNEYGWWCVANGQVRFDYTGLWSDPNVGWWYVENGAINFNYSGLVPNEYGWWKVTNGAVDFGYTGMAENESGWWKITNGGVDFAYTGIAENQYGEWYMENGTVAWDYTGFVETTKVHEWSNGHAITANEYWVENGCAEKYYYEDSPVVNNDKYAPDGTLLPLGTYYLREPEVTQWGTIYVAELSGRGDNWMGR